MITVRRPSERQHRRTSKQEAWFTFDLQETPEPHVDDFGALEQLNGAATHVEHQSLTAQRTDNSNEPIGVGREQCGDCRSQHQAYAQDKTRPGYPEPVVVADPAHSRVYNHDGSVDVYDTNNNHVTSTEPGEPTGASRTNYKGVPW